MVVKAFAIHAPNLRSSKQSINHQKVVEQTIKAAKKLWKNGELKAILQLSIIFSG